MDQKQLEHDIITVRDLLGKSLTIPPYQRPYKWQRKHVRQLMEDVLAHGSEKNETYRFGTLVLHKKTIEKDREEGLDIVDGQQRMITLVLIVMAIHEDKRLNAELDNLYFAYKDSTLAGLRSLEFRHKITHQNVYHNYQEIKRCLETWDHHTLKFLLDQCELVWVELGELSEAFQFFDSQNSRGKDLFPHDLLKAFHLRALPDRSPTAQEEAVRKWEKLEPQDLGSLFEDYLFRIRNWSKGRSARYFTKDDVGIFKGVNVDGMETYPYRKSAVIVNHAVNDYNSHEHRKLDGQQMAYPYQLDQVILNGKHFFEWVAHYEALRRDTKSKSEVPSKKLGVLLQYLDNYHRRYQTGDQYVRMMFDCSLIYFRDRFGDRDLDAVSVRLFLWAYWLRLERSRVQMASIDNHAIDSKMFIRLGDALTSMEIMDTRVKAWFKENWERIKPGDSIGDLIEKL
jgi:Protein of unknown function DUF262